MQSCIRLPISVSTLQKDSLPSPEPRFLSIVPLSYDSPHCVAHFNTVTYSLLGATSDHSATWKQTLGTWPVPRETRQAAISTQMNGAL